MQAVEKSGNILQAYSKYNFQERERSREIRGKKKNTFSPYYITRTQERFLFIYLFIRKVFLLYDLEICQGSIDNWGTGKSMTSDIPGK